VFIPYLRKFFEISNGNDFRDMRSPMDRLEGSDISIVTNDMGFFCVLVGGSPVCCTDNETLAWFVYRNHLEWN